MTFLLCEARRGALTVKFSPSTLSPPTKSSCDTRHLPSCLLFEHDHWEAAAVPKSRGSAAVATPFSESCLRALLRRFSCTSPLPSAPCCRTRRTCQWPPGEARATETSPSRPPFLPRHGTPYSGELRSQNLAGCAHRWVLVLDPVVPRCLGIRLAAGHYATMATMGVVIVGSSRARRAAG
jgi:hypothetical protein